MKWAEYYRRYDEWQESTQYSRVASITDFGPEGSPLGGNCGLHSVCRITHRRKHHPPCFGRWYYGHGHTDGCEFRGNGGSSGKCHID